MNFIQELFSAKRWRFRTVIVLGILFAKVSFGTITIYANNNPVPAASTKPTLKTVETICIGHIIGDPVEVDLFRTNLSTNLQIAGFSVGKNDGDCNATLLGRLQTEPSTVRGLWKYKHTEAAAWVTMKLVTEHYETLWEKSFAPATYYIPLGLYPFYLYAKSKGYVRGKGYIKHNGIYNRSLDISRSIASAKKKKASQ